MDKRERVMAMMNGKPADKIPTGFWLHFPKGYESGEKAVDVHMDFFEKTGTDICKVMNENLLPDDPFIKTASDWSKIKSFSKQSKFIVDQIELVKRVADRVNQKAVVLATVHGTAASLSHILGGGGLYDTNKLLQVEHLRENAAGMKAGIEAVTEILSYLAEESIKAGADGIYYAALGGETYTYTNEEFDAYIKPSDMAIMAAASKRECFNALHICKDHIDLSKYQGYSGELVNWGVYSENESLIDGKKHFPGKVILGGLDDRAGVLVDGTTAEITKEVEWVIDGFGTERFMLGADCTLPTEIDYNRILCAVNAAANYRKPEERQ